MHKDAVLSPCWKYRYSLIRRWGTGPHVVFIGLNPSTADARLDDPTIRRCMVFAEDWGFSAIRMLNLFAYRATKPEDMLAATDPVGPFTDRLLMAHTEGAGAIVAAWGIHGVHQGRDEQVKEMFKGRLSYLRLTKEGHPGHPLYLPKTLTPVPWDY